jgi:transposase
MGEVARLSVTGVRRPRRRWTLAEKLAIVEAAKTSGDPVSVVARRHGMNANHLFNWLQRDRDGTLDRGALYAESLGATGFIDLGVVAGAEPRQPGLMEIDLPGGAKVRVSGEVGSETLREVLLALTCPPKPCG